MAGCFKNVTAKCRHHKKVPASYGAQSLDLDTLLVRSCRSEMHSEIQGFSRPYNAGLAQGIGGANVWLSFSRPFLLDHRQSSA